MNKTAKFKKGQIVYIKHQRDLGEFVVANRREKTDMIFVGTNEPVVFYVRISSTDGNPRLQNLGYHQENLDLIGNL